MSPTHPDHAGADESVPEVRIVPPDPTAREAWNALIELAGEDAKSWVLVGGQAAYVRTVQGGGAVPRPTSDIDIVLDARDHIGSAATIPGILKRLGFEAIGGDHLGRQHRWVRGDAVIDVLQPRFLGERAEMVLKKSHADTIPAPGSQHAIRRSELVRVLMDDNSAIFRCPTPLGVVVSKAGAYLEVIHDPNRDRHLEDIAETLPFVQPFELSDNPLSPTERTRLRRVFTVLRNREMLTYVMQTRASQILEANQN